MKLIHKILAASLFTVALSAQATAINASDRGWYNYGSPGLLTIPSNTNYLTGWARTAGDIFVEYRSYFVFDLSAYSGQQVNSAMLHLYNPAGPTTLTGNGFYSLSPTEEFQVNQVTTDINNLVDGTAGLDGFNDLGDGTVFGSYVASVSDNGQFIDILLNAAALSDISNRLGGQIAFGGSLSTLARIPTSSETVFGFSNDGPYDSTFPTTQLILDFNSVPAPPTLTLFGLGFACMMGIRKAKKVA